MTFGSNSLNDFPKIVQTTEISTKTEKTFLVFSPVAVGVFLEWTYCCSIDSTHLNAALLIQTFRRNYCMVWYGKVNVDLYSAIITKSLMR